MASALLWPSSAEELFIFSAYRSVCGRSGMPFSRGEVVEENDSLPTLVSFGNGRAAGKQPRPLRLLTTFASTSPKGRGLGKEMKFAWTAKGSPFGRAGKADRL